MPRGWRVPGKLKGMEWVKQEPVPISIPAQSDNRWIRLNYRIHEHRWIIIGNDSLNPSMCLASVLLLDGVDIILESRTVACDC